MAAIEDMYPASSLHIAFLKEETTQQLSRLLMSDGLQGMLEGKDYHLPK